ncbi:protein BIG GRAIN 1-like E [Amaranthus tricolor]|uniref:protein BIG GRAIN 1-like E n=1 Tax=Amaranthus tricolor TaxID=29722 RepID=UPI0025863EE7|nr:protein BIG GRAIN 1-like E [Amaranthus tricolor]
MSIKDYRNKSFHRRNNSGELDVFEAARYFSTSNDNNALLACTNLSQKMGTKNERKGYLREGRVSLDVPSLKHFYLQNNHPILENHQQQQKTKEKKKYKQPSSPGGKIAQFLNSLFSQTSSKKKKAIKSLSFTQSMKDEDESPIGRRKRRSSISHFRSTSSAIDSRSLYSSSSSGFRTPPYNLNTPKSYKDFKSFSEYKDVLATLSKYNIQGNGNGKVHKGDKIKGSNNLDWVDEKLRLKNGLVEKSKNFNGYKEKTEHKKFNHDDDDDDHDGAESDSSSDLFELQIDYGYGFCSSGLPVYETTHMDNIKRSSATAITNGPIKA